MTQIGLDYAGPVYYRNSGKTSIHRLLLALLTITPAVAIAGALYALIAAHLPSLGFAKLVLVAAMLLMAGFAFGVGGLTGKMLMWARVRNLPMVGAIALWAAVFAWYVSWVVWEWHTLNRMNFDASPVRLFTHPNGVWFVARAINKYGTFGMGDDGAIKGPVLWFLWAIEAAVVLGVASFVPYRMVRGLSFCEACQKWGRKREGVLSVGPAPDEDRLRARLALKDLSALEELGQGDMSAPRRLRIDLQNCPSCDGMHLLSVSRIDVSYPKGQRKEKAKLLVDRLWVDAEHAQAVQQIKDRVYAGPLEQAAQGADAGANADSASAEDSTTEADPTEGDPRRTDAGMGL